MNELMGSSSDHEPKVHQSTWEQRLNSIIRAYLEAVETGRKPDQQQLLADHPEVADELESFFRSMSEIADAIGKPESDSTSKLDETTSVAIERHEASDSRDRRTTYFIRGYQLLDKLGEGGMGAVYLAVHTQLEKRVAIKVLKGHLETDKTARKRFQNEIRAIGRFEHEHIVRALDAGKTESGYFLVMEFIDGANLSQLVRRCHPISVADACELIRQAAIGLSHAHELEIIHRDVKPSNLMITPSGSVKLMDLGLAQLRQPHFTQTALTVDGQVLGTLKYMAPEQLEGKKVDATCDVYSLGVTLLELLFGELPPTVIKNGIDWSKHPLPRSDIPVGLVELIQAMTAPIASDRPQTASEVAQRLSEWSSASDLSGLFRRYRQEGRSLVSATNSDGDSVGRLASRRWQMSVAVTTLVACLLLVLGLFSWLGRSDRDDSPLPAGTDGVLRVFLEPGATANAASPLPIMTDEKSGEVFQLTEGENLLPPGNYRLWSDDWVSTAPSPLQMEAGAKRSMLLSPRENIGSRFPAHLPEIPKQAGAWAKFRAQIVPKGGSEHATQSYSITLRVLQSEPVDGRPFRWIQTEVGNSEYSETAWLMIDTDLYELEQELHIQRGFVRGQFQTDVSKLTAIVGQRPLVVWNDESDPLEELASFLRIPLPESRVSTHSLLAMMFGLEHPSVPAPYSDMRALVGSATLASREDTKHPDERGNMVSTWTIGTSDNAVLDSGQESEDANRPGNEPTVGYTIIRGKDEENLPFSFLYVDIQGRQFDVTLKRYNASSIGTIAEFAPDQLADQSIEVADFQPQGDEDYVRASLPTDDGTYARYSGIVKQGTQSEIAVEVLVRAGEQEEIEGKVFRWIEVQLDNPREATRESAKLLIDVNAYRTQRRFVVREGWLELNGEVFDFYDGNVTPAEDALVWLGKEVSPHRLRLHEVTTLLFNAQFPSSGTSRTVRSLIQGSITQDGATRKDEAWLIEVDGKDPITGVQVNVGPLEKHNLNYTLQWSEEIPFGFALVRLKMDGFEVYTEIVDFGQMNQPLLGEPDGVASLAEQTREKLSRLNVRFWDIDGEISIGQYQSESYYEGEFDVLQDQSIRSVAFDSLSTEDQRWIFETEARQWQLQSSETLRGIFDRFVGPENIRFLQQDLQLHDIPRSELSIDDLNQLGTEARRHRSKNR